MLGRGVLNSFWKTTISVPDQGSNLDIPVIGGLIYCKRKGVNYYNMDVDNLPTNEVQNNIEEAKKWPQYLAVILATLGSVCCGTVMGWTSPAIPILQNRTEESDGNLTEFNASVFADAGASSNDTELTLLFSDEDVSWIGSLAPLGAVAGALPAGHLANAFGRRWVLLWLNVPYLLGWVLITTTEKSVSGQFVLLVQYNFHRKEVYEYPLRWLHAPSEAVHLSGIWTVEIHIEKPPSVHPTGVRNPDLPVIGSLIYPESEALDYTATKVGDKYFHVISLGFATPNGGAMRINTCCTHLRGDCCWDLTRADIESSAVGDACVGLSGMLHMLPTPQISSLYFARFLLGLSMGIGSVVTPLYNEEIAQVEIRGTLGSSYDLLMAIGIVLVYILGTLVPYNWLNISCAGLCCVSFATFYFMPESPVHLLSKNKVKSAQRSLRWLRGTKYLSNYDIVPEMKQMQRLVDSSEKVKLPSSLDGVRRRLNGFSWGSPTTKSFLIASFLMFLRQFCAFNAAIYYTVEIFKEAGSMMSPFLSTIVVGSIQIPATLLATFLVDRYGRRVLLLASSASMASCLLVLSLYFCLKDFLDATSSFSWVPLVSLSLYVAGFSVGLGPIPWFMVAELVPIESKGWVIGIVVAINWLCTFVVTKVFTSMISGISSQMTYGFFCAVCTLGTFLIVYVVPETNGKTLDEIQTELAEKSFCPPMFCVKNGDTAL
uniref:Major facilitator superfamily (MFS) profile domain-containing protein n=1 Tax=Timema bartmani TaxID=61472 RepID=A0A7R9EWJ8_9NEOP|nr:unnamed protein product [Timema bartmani]